MLRFEIGHKTRKGLAIEAFLRYTDAHFLCPCLTNVVVIIYPMYVLSVGFIDVEIIGKER